MFVATEVGISTSIAFAEAGRLGVELRGYVGVVARPVRLLVGPKTNESNLSSELSSIGAQISMNGQAFI